MAQFNATAFSLTGQVRAHKPNAKASQILKDLNARIRALLDFRNSWSALISKTVLNIPQAYTTGAVTCTSGSTAILGTGTSWPVSDVVNTTMVGGNRQSGYQEITPASMGHISVGTFLYVNDSTFSEVAAVVETSNSTFTAEFRNPHNDGTVLTSSSLAGRQLRLGPLTPIYTLLAVSGATGPDNTGVLDMAFGGGSLVNTSYTLLQAYFTIDPNIRSFLQVWDPTQGIPLRYNVSQAELDCIDAQRTSSGWPQCLADLGPDASGTMQYELWPYQISPYSIPILYNRQWPEMKRPTDRPPYFINPSVIIDGAIADALRRKDLRDNSPADADPYFNPQLAKEFDQKFLIGAANAANADEEKCQQRLSSSFFQPGGAGGPGASYWQSHVNDGGYW